MKIITGFAMLVFSTVSLAAGFQSTSDTRKFSDALLDQFVAKQFKAALESAKSYWPIPESEIDTLANQIAEQWPIVDKRFGSAMGKEFIREERIGKSFLRYYYLHKFANHAIYWKIDFYRPSDEWKVNSIIFLDSLDDLYEQAR